MQVYKRSKQRCCNAAPAAVQDADLGEGFVPPSRPAPTSQQPHLWMNGPPEENVNKAGRMGEAAAAAHSFTSILSELGSAGRIVGEGWGERGSNETKVNGVNAGNLVTGPHLPQRHFSHRWVMPLTSSNAVSQRGGLMWSRTGFIYVSVTPSQMYYSSYVMSQKISLLLTRNQSKPLVS